MDEQEYTIDILELAEALKDNRKPIAKITGLMTLGGLLFLLLAWFLFPRYESVAMLQIKQRQGVGSGFTMMASMAGGDFLNGSSSSIDSYIEILKSRGVVVPVIEATEGKNFFGKYPEYEKYVEKRITAKQALVGGAIKHNSSEILYVTVKHKTAEKAQQVNQLLIENFLKRVAELNAAEKGTMKNFLEDRLKTAKDDLLKAETALERFKVEHKILSPSSNAQIFIERMVEAEKQAAENQIALEANQARLAAINQQLTNSAAASADNVTIQKYNEELAKLETTRIAYKDKYTEKHPRMIEINERIASLKTKIEVEVGKIAALQAPSDNEVHMGLVGGKYAAEGAVTVAKQKAEALQKLIDQNNEELAKLPAMEQEFVRLSRDYSVANEINMLLIKKLEETKITEHQGPDNVLVVDPPHLPDKPAFPKKIVTVLMAALLGFLGSCGYVLIRELQNRTIRSASTIAKGLQIPVLGSIPNKGTFVNDSVATNTAGLRGIKEKVRVFIWKS